MKKPLDVLAVVHLGKYKDGMIVDDNCPCCEWEPPSIVHEDGSVDGISSTEPESILGQMWMPGVEKGMGSFFQIFHCQSCGIVYATHLN